MMPAPGGRVHNLLTDEGVEAHAVKHAMGPRCGREEGCGVGIVIDRRGTGDAWKSDRPVGVSWSSGDDSTIYTRIGLQGTAQQGAESAKPRRATLHSAQ